MIAFSDNPEFSSYAGKVVAVIDREALGRGGRVLVSDNMSTCARACTHTSVNSSKCGKYTHSV